MSMPAITLTAALEDIFGAAVGSAANPVKLCICLCGYGPVLPRIAGTAMLARVGPTYLESTNGSFSTLIWGNDAITPAGTYYSVEVIDQKGNVVQAAAYQFTGSGTIDLSGAGPYVPTPPNPSGYILLGNVSGNITVNVAGWTGPVVIDMTLVGDTTLVSLSGLTKGQAVYFLIRQDATGGHAFTWPSNVKNPPLVDGAADSVSSASFVVDYLLNLYPMLGWNQ